jgi:hypothetical protein
MANMTVSRYELLYYKNGINLMTQKGSEGDEITVNKLAEEGGNLWDAVYGYALGEHHELVQKALKKDPKLISAAATGYARASNSKEITKLNGIAELKPHLVYGFSLAGDETQVRAALNSRDGVKYLPIIIDALASTNQSVLLFEFIANTNYFSKALKAGAKSGHHELVVNLLTKLSIDIKALPSPLTSQQNTALGYALEGYSEGRHFSEAAELIELGINPMFCLNALTPDGELDPVDASMLLSTVKKPATAALLTGLMKSQFDLKPEQLSASLPSKPLFERNILSASKLSNTSLY